MAKKTDEKNNGIRMGDREKGGWKRKVEANNEGTEM